MSGVGRPNDVPFPYTDPGFKITLPEDSPNHKVVDMTMPDYDMSYSQEYAKESDSLKSLYRYIVIEKKYLPHKKEPFKNADDVVQYIQRNAEVDNDDYEPLKTLLRTPEFDDFDVINTIFAISIMATVDKIPILRYPVMMVVMNKRIARYILARAFFADRIKNIEFHSLYSSLEWNTKKGKDDHRIKDDVEKLKCIYNYFKRAVDFTNDQLDQKIIFHLTESDSGFDISDPLGEFQAYDEGTIESHGVGMLQVDFANEHIGGGVLGSGPVQEEIRFFINPELIVGRCVFYFPIFYRRVGIIIGTEQFSSYTGSKRRESDLAPPFEFSSDYEDQTPTVDIFRVRTNAHIGIIRNTAIMAVDDFRTGTTQYTRDRVKHELSKLHAGFRLGLTTVTPIATGNWGSGASGGDIQLTAMLQWAVASKYNRPVAFFTSGMPHQKNALHALRSYFSSRGGVEHILCRLTEYCEYKLASNVNDASLLDWIANFSGQNWKEIARLSARPSRSLEGPASPLESPTEVIDKVPTEGAPNGDSSPLSLSVSRCTIGGYSGSHPADMFEFQPPCETRTKPDV